MSLVYRCIAPEFLVDPPPGGYSRSRPVLIVPVPVPLFPVLCSCLSVFYVKFDPKVKTAEKGRKYTGFLLPFSPPRKSQVPRRGGYTGFRVYPGVSK